MRKSFRLNVPTLGFIVATRAALAFGAGLLISEKMSHERRRTLGLLLVGVGAATTIPAVNALAKSLRPS